MDLKLLQQIIKDQGLNYYKMGRLMRMSHTGFRKKLIGESEFKVSEIVRLKKVLNLDDATILKILFGGTSNE